MGDAAIEANDIIATNYERDVAAWAVEQAQLIRAKRFDLLDLEHVADEIEDVGKSERRELASRMSLLLAHLLKWQFQPARQGGSWQRTIREQRKQVRRKLDETPSLGPLLQDADWLAGVWADAVVMAIADTSLDNLPEACPWPMADIMTESWLPGA